jgi:hypothetical protein
MKRIDFLIPRRTRWKASTSSLIGTQPCVSSFAVPAGDRTRCAKMAANKFSDLTSAASVSSSRTARARAAPASSSMAPKFGSSRCDMIQLCWRRLPDRSVQTTFAIPAFCLNPSTVRVSASLVVAAAITIGGRYGCAAAESLHLRTFSGAQTSMVVVETLRGFFRLVEVYYPPAGGNRWVG